MDCYSEGSHWNIPYEYKRCVCSNISTAEKNKRIHTKNQKYSKDIQKIHLLV